MAERHPDPGSRQLLTPPQLAEHWGISPDKILGWIRSGELRAIDLARRQGGRPRYRIRMSDIEDFERRREAAPAAAPQRRRKAPADVIEFF